MYKYGYSNFTLKDFCDGYIFLNPMSEYETVTVIPNFITPEKVAFVKQQEWGFRNKDLSAKDINDTIRTWINDTKIILKEMSDK